MSAWLGDEAEDKAKKREKRGKMRKSTEGGTRAAVPRRVPSIRGRGWGAGGGAEQQEGCGMQDAAVCVALRPNGKSLRDGR